MTLADQLLESFDKGRKNDPAAKIKDELRHARANLAQAEKDLAHATDSDKDRLKQKIANIKADIKEFSDKIMKIKQSESVVGHQKKVQSLQKKISLLRNEINSKHNDSEAKKRFQDELHDAERRLRITRAA